jgi:Rad3-related DNA helicase
VVLVGATVREKTAALLGANPIDIGLHEYPSSFDVRRRPIYHIPVPYGGGTVRLNYKASDEELRAVWRAMDRFIEPRFQTRKGIIHTVSYKRRDQIFQGSEFASAMQAHDSRNLAWAIERFKAAPPPAILPSPSISTGIDLPDDQCRWILIPKLPYPDTRSAVMQARVRADPELAPYMVAQELQQMTGRGNRHVGDWCECAIFDDLFRWFISRHYRLFARWWVEALVRLKPGVQPAPLEVEEVPSVRR